MTEFSLENRDQKPSIPITLVIGFLGSGKTTAILNYLNHKAPDERVAILVNDFGRIGVDSSTLRQSQSSSTVVHQVPGGCICCTAAVGMTLALMNIIETEDPDRIIIEPTGIAKPYEIEKLLRNRDFSAKAHLAQTIALFDLRKYAQTLIRPENEDKNAGAKTDFSAEEISALIELQLAEADLLVANFSDEVEAVLAKQTLDQFRQKLSPHQNIISTTRGQLSQVQFRQERKKNAMATPSRFRKPVHVPPKQNQHALFCESGKQWSADFIFDFEKIKTSVSLLITEAKLMRAKGQFKTFSGYQHLEWVAGYPPSWSSVESPLETSSFVELIARDFTQKELDAKLLTIVG